MKMLNVVRGSPATDGALLSVTTTSEAEQQGVTGRIDSQAFRA